MWSPVALGLKNTYLDVSGLLAYFATLLDPGLPSMYNVKLCSLTHLTPSSEAKNSITSSHQERSTAFP
jgi:hypothetical protein